MTTSAQVVMYSRRHAKISVLVAQYSHRYVTIFTTLSQTADTNGERGSAIEQLAQASVATPNGSTVTLSDVADFVESTSPTQIRRIAGVPGVTLEHPLCR